MLQLQVADPGAHARCAWWRQLMVMNTLCVIPSALSVSGNPSPSHATWPPDGLHEAQQGEQGATSSVSQHHVHPGQCYCLLAAKT